MNVRATVERLGREHVGKPWWADLAEALVAEFEPVVAERDHLEPIVAETEAILARFGMDVPTEVARLVAERDSLQGVLEQIVKGPPSNAWVRARAALDRGTP